MDYYTLMNGFKSYNATLIRLLFHMIVILISSDNEDSPFMRGKKEIPHFFLYYFIANKIKILVAT